MSERNPLVVTEGLTKHFPLRGGHRVHAVDGVSLTIHEKEIVGLVGESGSGKSTYGKTLIGLHDKTAGTATYRGEALPAKYQPKDFQRWAKKMQMIFQDPYSSLNPRMTVGEIIGEGLKLHTDLGKAEIRERVGEWLKKVGLEPDHMSRYPHEFSGGQRQRIGIARALVLNPRFIVCDEVTSALDVSVQARVLALLDELRRDFDLTYLFITHNIDVVRYFADDVAVMYQGRVVEQGDVASVCERPANDYTRRLLAAVPQFEAASEA